MWARRALARRRVMLHPNWLARNAYARQIRGAPVNFLSDQMICHEGAAERRRNFAVKIEKHHVFIKAIEWIDYECGIDGIIACMQ